MELVPSPRFFPETSMTLIQDLQVSGARLDEFVDRYGPPTRAYIGAMLRGAARSRSGFSGNPEATVEELSHDFFVDKIVVGRALQAFDRAKATHGFRPFFKMVLRNFLRDRLALDSRLKNCSIDDDDACDSLQDPAESPESAFHNAWVRALLDAALRSTKHSCEKGGLAIHFRLFTARYIGNASWEQLAKTHRIKDGKTARNMAQPAIRRFRDTLRTMVADETGADVLAIEELRRLLSMM